MHTKTTPLLTHRSTAIQWMLWWYVDLLSFILINPIQIDARSQLSNWHAISLRWVEEVVSGNWWRVVRGELQVLSSLMRKSLGALNDKRQLVFTLDFNANCYENWKAPSSCTQVTLPTFNFTLTYYQHRARLEGIMGNLHASAPLIHPTWMPWNSMYFKGHFFKSISHRN